MAHSILTVEQMRKAEQTMFARGVESYMLMRRAGIAVADTVMQRFPGRSVLVLAGPGNNGGDGFVAAEVLCAKGVQVQLALNCAANALKGDAARAARDFSGIIVSVAEANLEANPVIVDALYGTGLSRPVNGVAARILHTIGERRMDVVAVDIPSGVAGDTGAIMGIAAQANVTVTFTCKKPGHVLMPGRLLAGEIIVADIGITEQAIAAAHPRIWENAPGLWRGHLHWPKPEEHKYNRGHVLAVGGPAAHAGAAKMAAMAALRVGAGLVTIICGEKDVPVYAQSALSLMTVDAGKWDALLQDRRCNAVLIGPGAGISGETRGRVLSALAAEKRCVFDADALTAFASNADSLFGAIASPAILTPHAGEFARLFPAIEGKGKWQKAVSAAARSHAVIVFKGFDTVIASPDGRAYVNTNAPPALATAGSGDVLAGICAGLLAQGMEAFDAACAGVWMHAEAARQQEAGLIAEDLPGRLPLVLESLKIGA